MQKWRVSASVTVCHIRHSLNRKPNNFSRVPFPSIWQIGRRQKLTFEIRELSARRELGTHSDPIFVKIKLNFLIFHHRRDRGDLNTKLVQYSNGQKEVGCQMVGYLNAIWIPDSLTIWIQDKLTPSCFLMYWSSIWIYLSLFSIFVFYLIYT